MVIPKKDCWRCGILWLVNKEFSSITIINDCRDGNAAGRQVARTASLFGLPTSLVGVSNDLEAAGNLIDIIDAYDGRSGIILVNVAPRHGKAKKWKNGTPFGYFRYNNLLIVTTIDGLTLSLVKKFELVDEIKVMDIPTVAPIFHEAGVISEIHRERLSITQFRSFDFSPYAAKYLSEHAEVESETLSVDEIADAPNAVWWVDNFGNVKTTILSDEVAADQPLETTFGTLNRFEYLKDVPNDERALIAGSSGLGNRRFMEIVVQGKSAAKELGLSSGDIVSQG